MSSETRKTALLLDFDGTASLRNVGMSLIQRFARDNSWMVIDEDYEKGRVGSRTAYGLMGPILTGTLECWRGFVLSEHGLDPGLSNLVGKARGAGYLVEVLSDGLDLYINLLLEREGLDLPVRSSLVSQAAQGVKVDSPYMNPLCGRCGTCKSERIQELKSDGWTVVFVGDGLSDLCAAPKADRIFAKDHLAAHLREKSTPFEPFSTLNDVAAALFGP